MIVACPCDEIYLRREVDCRRGTARLSDPSLRYGPRAGVRVDPPVEADPRERLLCFVIDLEGRLAGPSPPPSGRGPGCSRKTNGHPLSIHHVYYIKPMNPSGEHGRGPLLAPGECVSPGRKSDRGPHPYSCTHTHTVLCRARVTRHRDQSLHCRRLED